MEPEFQTETTAPLFFEENGINWVRTEVSKGSDLVNGKAWIAEFERRLTLAKEVPQSAGQKPTRRRLLRQVATDGDNPQYWATSKEPPLHLRNDVLRMMESERMDHTKGPGRKVRLATGHDVIFWFNVGPPGDVRERVYVTDARCPHQGVCLNTGELKDIEDVGGTRRGMVRCPRHNKIFDLRTGESPGNAEKLRTYPARYEQGHWYVGIELEPETLSRESTEEMDVDVGNHVIDSSVIMEQMLLVDHYPKSHRILAPQATC